MGPEALVEWLKSATVDFQARHPNESHQEIIGSAQHGQASVVYWRMRPAICILMME